MNPQDNNIYRPGGTNDPPSTAGPPQTGQPPSFIEHQPTLESNYLAQDTQPDAQPVADDPGAKTAGGDKLRSVLSTIFLFLLAPLIAFLISMFVIQSYQVEGRSMESTLQDQDRLIVNKSPRTWSRLTGHSYIPHRGDIIIFNQGEVTAGSKPKQLIKRVIGIPGERVVIEGGKVTVYNQQNPSGFNPDTSGIYEIQARHTPGDVDLVVGEAEVFVCGDNRTNSEDSRYFGPIRAEQIVGKLSLRVLPLNKARNF